VDATRVEDLLARLSPADAADSRRQRRSDSEPADTVPAGELIAALTAARAAADDTGNSAADRVADTTDTGADAAEPPADDPAAADLPAPPGIPSPEGVPAALDLPSPPDTASPQHADAAPSPETTGAAAPDTPSPETAGAAAPDTASPHDITSPLGLPPHPGDAPTTVLAATLDHIGPVRPGAEPPVVPSAGPDASWESVLESLRRQVGAPSAGHGGRRPPVDPPITRPPGPSHGAHHGWLVAGRSVVAVVAILVLLITGTEWVIKHRADQVLSDRQVQAIVPDDTNISTPTVSHTTAEPEGAAGDKGHATVPPPRIYQPENILLMGSDTRAGKQDALLGHSGPTSSDTMQSDVLMIAHLSADRQHVTVVSIPRDLYVTAPTCKAWDYTTNSLSDQDYVTPYSIWKITNAFSVGGPQCTVRAVQRLTGLKIDRVIIIDFAGFKSMVDALGGIDINACRPIVDDQLGTVITTPGEQHIDGLQALALVRARKVHGDPTGDLGRIHRQQMVLSTILRQVTSAGVLLNPARLDSLLQAFVHNVWTDNVTLDDLIELAQSLGDLSPSRVTFYTLPTVPDGEGLQMTSAGPVIWNALVNDEQLSGEPSTSPSTSATAGRSSKHPAAGTGTTSAAGTSTSTRILTSLVTTTPTVHQSITVAPQDVDLQVVNVAGRGGVATQAMNALNPLGFHVTEPDLLLIPGQVQSDITVQFSRGNRAAAVTVASAVPGARLVRTDGLDGRVRLMVGSSFDGAVTGVTVGDPVRAALSTTPSPVVGTVVTTEVVRVAARADPTTSAPPSTSVPPSTHRTAAGPTLSTKEVDAVNAGNASCV
jgi:LCP family protein required for cell wall assembly